MGPLGHSIAALTALAGLPLGALGCALRPAWRAGLGERLGRMPEVEPSGLWLHAASLGETRATAALLKELGDAQGSVLLTHTSPSGRALDDRALARATRAFAPLDHPWCVAAALRSVRPRAIALIETEIWPFALAQAAERGIPVVVVSGRISDRSWPRYLRARRLLAPSFARLAAVGARAEADAERFRTLGVPSGRVRVTGDLKLDEAAEAAGLAPEIAASLGDRPLLVAGSTHPGEERAAAEAFLRCRARGLPVALAVAPRRPARADAIANELAELGLRARRRTRPSPDPLAADEFWLFDLLGELPALYVRAELAFVGGTLAPVGGHNLLEPVQRGTPVLFGPHIENVGEAARLLEESGAGARIADVESFAETACEWLADPHSLRARGERGRRALAQHRGSAARSLALIEACARAGGPA